MIATDYQGMIEQGEELAALHSQIVVKLPMIASGVKACWYFTEKNWEAILYAAGNNVDNLIVTIDLNGQQIDGSPMMYCRLETLRPNLRLLGGL